MPSNAFNTHPPSQADAILRIQTSLIAPHFTAADAWDIGCALRQRLLYSPKPCVISISLSTSQPLFFCTSGNAESPTPAPGSNTQLDNASWVARKSKTVLRFGVPSYYMNIRFAGDELKFRNTFGMGAEEAGAYAIHGGAVPIKVKGVEGVVAVVVVSGLKQDEDHGVVVEVLGEWLKGLKD